MEYAGGLADSRGEGGATVSTSRPEDREGGGCAPGDDSSDPALAKRAREGSGAAFEQLVRRHQRVVYAICRRVCGSHEEADDAAQETFVQLWRSLDRYDPGRPFLPWLYRVAMHTALKRLARIRSRREVGLDTVDSLPGQPARAGSDPGEAFASAEGVAKTRRALARLKLEERLLLELRAECRMSYEELAATLDIPLGTVMSRLHRARQALRRELTLEGVEVNP